METDPLPPLVEALQGVPPEARDNARADALSRPIHYPFGSGESDEIALRAGLRPLIRQLLPASELELTRARFEQRAFFVEVAPQRWGRTRDGWDPDHEGESVGPYRQAVFIGRDRGRIQEAMAADLAKSSEGDRELGRLLGYPRCCVEGFVESSRQRRNPDTFRAALARTRGPLAPRLNVLDLAVFHWVSWFPCAFDCALSLRYADAVAAIVASTEPLFVQAIDAALARHRLVLLDQVQVSMEGPWDGHTLQLASVYPTARDRHPRALLADDELQAVEAVTALLRQSRTMILERNALVLDGARIELPRPPLLVPFGSRS